MLPDPTSPVPVDGSLKPFPGSRFEPEHIVVLGAGAFGTAIAIMLARARHHVTLIDVVESRIQHIAAHKKNPDFLTEFTLPPTCTAVFDPKLAFTRRTKYVFHAIPIQFTLNYLNSIKSAILREHIVAEDPTYVPTPLTFINLAKGIHLERLQLISDIFDEVFGIDQKTLAKTADAEAPAEQLIRVAYMAGPSFAVEIANALPTGFVVASAQIPVAQDVASLVSMDEHTLCMFSGDYIGLQVNSALKNCYAIMCGMVTGLGYKSNTLCMMITLASLEIRRLTRYLFNPEGTPLTETASMGFAGIGDLVLTTTGESRNRALGARLAQGLTLDQAMKQSAGVVEGVPTVQAAYKLLVKHDFVKHAPLLRALYAVMYDNQTVESALTYLLSMPAQHEYM